MGSKMTKEWAYDLTNHLLTIQYVWAGICTYERMNNESIRIDINKSVGQIKKIKHIETKLHEIKYVEVVLQ